jgi:ribonuclease D
MPALLSQVLQDSSIRKVGVGLAEDAAKLLADWGAEVVSCVDLACAAKAEGLTHLTSLAKCSLHLLGLAMCKNKKIRMGNWERLPLSPAQVMNAIHYYNNIKYIVYLINLYTKTLFTSLRTRRWMRGLLPKGFSDSRRHPSPVENSTRVG